MTIEQQHLNLAASRALAELGVELMDYDHCIEASNLHELITLLPQIGEKCGGFVRQSCKSGCGCEYPYGSGAHEFECVWVDEKIGSENVAYTILDIILSGGTMDKEVSEYLLSIIKK